jgi:hypothetical protein
MVSPEPASHVYGGTFSQPCAALTGSRRPWQGSGASLQGVKDDLMIAMGTELLKNEPNRYERIVGEVEVGWDPGSDLQSMRLGGVDGAALPFGWTRSVYA